MAVPRVTTFTLVTLASLSLLLLAGCATPRGPTDRSGADVGIAFDTAGERGSYAFGLADPATGRKVTIDDPVRVASVSKLVVAIGVMQLVEQGRLSLDEDAGRLLGWPLRNPAFPGKAVTLRMLLSHTSGVRDHDDQYAIPLGGSLRDVMSDPRSWDPQRGPGDGYFVYSNMNFPVVASIVERATGERFDRFMHRILFAPLAIDACFNWPTCSDAAVEQAVVLTQGGRAVRDDLKGGRPPCPVQAAADGSCAIERWRAGENGALFAPQGGLRISAVGMARIGRLLLGSGTLDGVRVLKPSSVVQMLEPQWRFDGRNGVTEGFYCSYGLATQTIASGAPGCDDDPVGDGVPRVGHAGEAYGLRSGLWIDGRRGTGVFYYRTGLPADTPRGRSGFRAVEEASLRRSLNLLGSMTK